MAVPVSRDLYNRFAGEIASLDSGMAYYQQQIADMTKQRADLQAVLADLTIADDAPGGGVPPTV
jgi:hypothetical protein